MPKPLTDYCSNPADLRSFRQLHTLLKPKDKDLKLKLALTALYISCLPDASVPIPSELIEAMPWLDKLSNRGLLDLCYGLLEEARHP